jgi:uncharacterized membrane protein YgcG
MRGLSSSPWASPRRLAWAGRFLLALAALTLPGSPGNPPGLPAQDREVVIDRFESDIEIRSDGTFEVVETLQVRFVGSWNGLARELFFDHETAEGRRTRLQLELGEITDGDGRPLRVDRSGIRRGIGLAIWVPDARDAIRTVVIRYRVGNGLRFFRATEDREPWDELYYNVTGSEWRSPIRAVEARIRLPEGLEPTGAWGYTGPEGSTEQAVEIERSGREVRVRTTRPFGPREGLTVSVTWPEGVVARPSVAEGARARFLMYWPLGLPILALSGMLGLWVRKGRDPVRTSVMAEYEPPPGLTPSEVGTLADHKAQMHDITSTLVDLAVRGYVRIEEVETKSRIPLLGRKQEEWIFHQTRPTSAWRELAPHERAYLEGLFEPALEASASPHSPGELFEYLGASFRAWREARREKRSFDAQGFMTDWFRERREPDGTVEGEETLVRVKLSELENRFYTHIPKIKTKIYRELENRGYYLRRPDHVVARWIALGAGMMVAAVALGIVAAQPPLLHQALPEPLPLGLGVALSGIIVLLVGQGMGVRTEEGSRALMRILGFREFLSRVESDYYDRIVTTPELFERYLAYAIALQVESRWAKAFDGLYREAPDWYQGPSSGAAFRPTAFAGSMKTLSTRAGQTMSSSPSSSGSGGGGSSGGGSGGGGGGGF